MSYSRYNFNLSKIQSDSTGLDAFFERSAAEKEAAKQPPKRVKVANLASLEGFSRVSEDVLVRKSTNDLWSLHKDGDSYYIERLFEPTDVIKG